MGNLRDRIAFKAQKLRGMAKLHLDDILFRGHAEALGKKALEIGLADPCRRGQRSGADIRLQKISLYDIQGGL